VELCEDYWALLRSDAKLFSQMPEKLFAEEPKLSQAVTRFFCLKLMVVTVIGLLVSNHDYKF
jgi:hypothetical protein